LRASGKFFNNFIHFPFLGRLLNPGGNMLYYDFPFGADQLAGTFNYAAEKQSDIFYCHETDRRALPGLISAWRMFVSNKKSLVVIVRNFHLLFSYF
jgi:hypothetical protein